jgi:XapX domain-containing protein
MKLYLISLGAGVLVGVIYGLLSVRSPAPPVIALIGLAGMLLGEQLVPLAKKLIAREHVSVAWLVEHFRSHTFGKLPTHSHAVAPEAPAAGSTGDT